MGIVFRKNLIALSESAGELRQMNPSPGWRMELDALLRHAVWLFEQVKAEVGEVQRSVAAGTLAMPAADVMLDGWESEYRELFDTFNAVANVVTLARAAAGEPSKEFDAFAAAWRELRGITAFTRAEVREAEAQLDRGEGRNVRDMLK
jgi:hypothetical protein